MIFSTDSMVLLISILLLVGVATTKFSSRMGLPSLVLYIIVGMVLSHFIYFDNAALTQWFGIFALIVILFEGGMQTNWKTVKPVIRPSLSLATLGVLLTAGLIGTAAKFILDVTWLEGLLFGAIVGSTDAAAVFAVLGSKNIRSRLSATLEAESGTNDPMAVFLTISLISIIQSGEASFLHLVASFMVQMGFGLVAGLLIGKVAVKVINRIHLDSSGLYPVLALSFAIFAYGFTALIGGSGLLAVYVMALILGNSDITFRHSIFRFHEGFAWMMQILMFILLGLLVFPAELIHVFWQGIGLSLLLMVVARPIGVFISMLPFRFNYKEKVLLSWAGLRGAVPIVLATYPLMEGMENGALFFNAVFFVVLTSALVQGATISPLASWLKLSDGPKHVVPYSLELISTGKRNTDIIQVVLEEDAGAAGNEIQKLQLPEDVLITAVIRGDTIITPRGNTILQPLDVLYVIAPTAQKETIKEFFLAPEKSDEDSEEV